MAVGQTSQSTVLASNADRPSSDALRSLSETALSIVVTSGRTSGINGTFCAQIHFFASCEAAVRWIAGRTDFAVLAVAEGYELARRVYVDPLLEYNPQ